MYKSGNAQVIAQLDDVLVKREKTQYNIFEPRKAVNSMAFESNTYSGTCEYKNIDFTFIFSGEELRLVPPLDKRDTILTNWILTPLEKGVYTRGNPLTMDEPYLTGKCNETGTTFVFITKQGGRIGSQNSVLFIPIIAYIRCRCARDSIARMSFTSPVINCIHPVNQGFGYAMDVDSFNETGVFTVTTQSFDDTTTEPQIFMVDNVRVSVRFSISRKLSVKLNEPPIALSSSMLFEFAPTNDYRLIYRLWFIAKQFLQYLCYRRNILLPEVVLSAPANDDKYEEFATMYVLNEAGDDESSTLKSGRYIQQKYLAGNEGKILSDIASGMLYLRHLPQTYQSGRTIDAARFIMITAAFEWEYKRNFPNGVPKKEARLKAEAAVTDEIDERIESSTGKKQDIYKFLKRLVKSDSLESEIIHTGDVIDDIIGVFGKHLYHLNGEELKYPEMGKRLSSQRNHYAHGDLDQEFIGLSLLDLMYMEYVVYAIQLNYYGIDEKNIRRAINELFHLNYAIT